MLTIALAMFAVTVACGSEDEPPPPTEAPTEAATPEPTEPPSATQPATGLEDLSMTAATTGQDVVRHISEVEAVCASEAFGAAGYEAFLGAELVAAYRDARQLQPLFNCLTPDNFEVFGMLYAGARAGGFAGDTQACLLALGREHPDAVVTVLGIEPPEAVAALFADTHNYVTELYDCLNTEERVELVVHMWSELGTYSIPVNDLMSAFTDEEITCFTDTFGITRAELEQMLATRQPGQTSADATPCITADTFSRIMLVALTVQLGEVTEESAACVGNFAVEHPHFLALARVGTFDPDMMSEAEFEEIAGDGVLLFGCFTDGELKSMQELIARALGSFTPVASP